ncbi:DoxX family protein [Paenibacillus sp. BSR1-1]|uniref:DoxX family protein n=1 Tax=Paenibacillus sp. BSR1-1 TaxID=3020845 RepID=UPI00339D9A6E
MLIYTSFSTSNLIRFAVAYVFITSGLMKLMSAELASSFLRLGLPYPYIVLKVVILLEIICGLLILVNKAVKNAVIPLIGIMIAALILTKLPTLNTGLLQFAFNARLDIVMIVLLFYLYKRYPN